MGDCWAVDWAGADTGGDGLMSTYYKGACHDCRQWIWLSNAGLEHAESCMQHWAKHMGHEGHRLQVTTEYDPIFEITIDGRERPEYLGYDEWKTIRTGAPYACMNPDGFGYDAGLFESPITEVVRD